jgi:NAD(P)-dependent dehydrogenase (short-subunit alcohol dehydrogenase family)
MLQNKKNWLITGVSSGFGRCLAEQVIARGDYVIGTVRKTTDVEKFTKDFDGRGEAVMMDVDHTDQIRTGVANILKQHQRIDVLVNNAGYGLFGAVEEVSEAEARAQMETNFFGPLALTQAVLPSMRAARGGHIVQISSIAGFRSTPGLGLYNASKYALEGFSEALALEVAPFGIKILIVEPGPFRTKWAGQGSRDAAQHIPDYAQSVHTTIKTIHEYDGNQPGDPAKAAALMIEALFAPTPPLRLPLGKSAIDRMKGKLSDMSKEIVAWESKSLATDFDR